MAKGTKKAMKIMQKSTKPLPIEPPTIPAVAPALVVRPRRLFELRNTGGRVVKPAGGYLEDN